MYTSASGSAGRLKLQLKDVQKHMAVLIELAHTITREVKPPRTLSREDIKRKYLAIGKLRGIENAPAAYTDEPQERSPNPASRTNSLGLALDALERCVRELAALVDAAERAVARQTDKLR